MIRTSLCALGVLLSGCGLAERRFVDPDGRPLQGVLVVSEQRPYILQDHEVGVFLSDPDGRAPVVDKDNEFALKAGYHAWENWRPDVAFFVGGPRPAGCGASDVVLFPVSGRVSEAVGAKRQTLTFVTDADERQAIAVPLEIGITVQCVWRNTLEVTADGRRLVESPGFYFAGPSSEERVSGITHKDSVFFYVFGEADTVYKVGLVRGGLVSMAISVDGVKRQVDAHDFEIRWAKTTADRLFLEPTTEPSTLPNVGPDTEILFGPDLEAIRRALDDAVARGGVRPCPSLRQALAAGGAH